MKYVEPFVEFLDLGDLQILSYGSVLMACQCCVSYVTNISRVFLGYLTVTSQAAR